MLFGGAGQFNEVIRILKQPECKLTDILTAENITLAVRAEPPELISFLSKEVILKEILSWALTREKIDDPLFSKYSRLSADVLTYSYFDLMDLFLKGEIFVAALNSFLQSDNYSYPILCGNFSRIVQNVFAITQGGIISRLPNFFECIFSHIYYLPMSSLLITIFTFYYKEPSKWVGLPSFFAKSIYTILSLPDSLFISQNSNQNNLNVSEAQNLESNSLPSSSQATSEPNSKNVTGELPPNSNKICVHPLIIEDKVELDPIEMAHNSAEGSIRVLLSIIRKNCIDLNGTDFSEVYRSCIQFSISNRSPKILKTRALFLCDRLERKLNDPKFRTIALQYSNQFDFSVYNSTSVSALFVFRDQIEKGLQWFLEKPSDCFLGRAIIEGIRSLPLDQLEAFSQKNNFFKVINDYYLLERKLRNPYIFEVGLYLATHLSHIPEWATLLQDTIIPYGKKLLASYGSRKIVTGLQRWNPLKNLRNFCGPIKDESEFEEMDSEDEEDEIVNRFLSLK